MAQVEVECIIEACQKCLAINLCAAKSQSKGILTVLNPLKAQAGDRVTVEIPETNYNKKLILLFGSLLFGSLLGMGTGYLCSLLLSYPSSVLGPLGLLFGLVLAGALLTCYFRKINKTQLYPVIKDIIKKGDRQSQDSTEQQDIDGVELEI